VAFYPQGSFSKETDEENMAQQSSTSLEYSEFVIAKDENGVWRKCPYCGSKVWDGLHSSTAPGFTFHLSTKNLAHASNAEWKLRFEKDSWHLGTQKS
jgi:hypothetical protein